MSFATKLKTLRTKKGMSQSALAKESGLSLFTIQKLEQGKAKAGRKSLIGLSRALNVSVDYLLV